MDTDWGLHRRGQLDQERHLDKITKAIEENLADLIEDASVQDGSGRVKVRLRELREHHFRFADGEGEGVGSGRPGTQQGDVIGRSLGGGDGEGKGGGDEHDEGTYEVWVSAEDVASHLFADLELPNIRPRVKSTVTDEEPVMQDIRRKGPMGLLSLRHTIRANLVRNSILGKPGFHGITDDDLRFKALDIRQNTKDQCVVLFIRDRSGSMGEFEKEMTRLGAFWTLAFLRQRYGKQVKPVYILHDTHGEVVDEAKFFGQTESGGTRISSGYEVARHLIETEYSPDAWNIYVVQFSDGDNLSSDNEAAIKHVQAMAKYLNLLAYWEIDASSGGPAYYRSTTFGAILNRELSHILVIERRTIKDKADIVKAVRYFFRRREVKAS